MNSIIFPKNLKKGAQIAIISPAGSVNESQLENGLKLIKSIGYEPVLGKHLYTNYLNGYLITPCTNCTAVCHPAERMIFWPS